MNTDDRNYLSYFILVLGVFVFVMLYVWQSVEVTKVRLEYKKLLRVQEQLVKENDRVIYEMERYKDPDYLERSAQSLGMKAVTPKDFETIDMK
jgi:cell division protein FtsL